MTETNKMLEECANYLLNHCFVLGGVEDQRAKYLYVQDHLNEVLFDRLMKASPEILRTETQLALITIEPPDFSERVLQGLLEEMEAEQTDAG